MDTPAPPTDVPSSSSTPPGPNDLILDRPSVQPGDRLSATGKGCVPGKAVTLTSDGKRVGSAYADGTGTVEQVVTSSSGGHSGTLVVLVFFVLAGITVLRFP